MPSRGYPNAASVGLERVNRSKKKVSRRRCWPSILKVICSPALLGARQAFLARRRRPIFESVVFEAFCVYLPISWRMFLIYCRNQHSATKQRRHETTSCLYSGHQRYNDVNWLLGLSTFRHASELLSCRSDPKERVSEDRALRTL